MGGCMKAPRHVSHDEVVVDVLKADPEIAEVYLATALEEADLPGGQFALLAALRCATLPKRKGWPAWPRKQACRAKAFTAHFPQGATQP